MKKELEKEILDSKILKFYVKIQKMAKYIPMFKWVAGISFIIAFIDTVINNQMSMLSGGLILAVWIPGILFAFVAGFSHFLAGIKLRGLASKYGMQQEEVQVLAGKIIDK